MIESNATTKETTKPIARLRVSLPEKLEAFLMPKAIERGGGDRGKLLWPLRAALSGRKTSPGPFEIMAVLGKNEVLKRIEKAISYVKE